VRIGIDIDGTMSEYDNIIIQTAREYGLKIDHPSYYIHDAYNISKAEEDKYWAKYYDKIQGNPGARANVREAINLLHKRGFEIWIVTGRSELDLPLNSNLNIISSSLDWLKKENIYYDKIFFRITNKGVFASKYHLGYMIEDSPEQIIYLNKHNIKTIIMNCSYNRNMQLNNTWHCDNWNSVNGLIK